MPTLREGFWGKEAYDFLPWPVEGQRWLGQDRFIAALGKIEAKATVSHYRGWSTCRICKKHNGSTEFSAKNWVWPVGFRHYVEAHNVRPSLAFHEFVLDMKADDEYDFYVPR